MLPTMDQFETAINEAVAKQIAWMKAEFGIGNVAVKIKIVDVPTGPLGQMKVLRKDRKITGYQLKFQSYHFLRDRVKAFPEYATYNAWPEIGGFETLDWRLVADALVAHEVAHLAQYCLKDAGVNHGLFVMRPGMSGMYFEGIGPYEGGHGKFFRQIYRRFRREFINDRVPASAYTAPRGEFTEGTDFEERMESKTGQHPLVGVKIEIKGKPYKIAGLNPRNAKLYGYMVERPDGVLARIKLAYLYKLSSEVQRIVDSNPKLKAELAQAEIVQQRKLVANAKSSMTKRIRKGVTKLALAA